MVIAAMTIKANEYAHLMTVLNLSVLAQDCATAIPVPHSVPVHVTSTGGS
jgi:hypothetical protein